MLYIPHVDIFFTWLSTSSGVSWNLEPFGINKLGNYQLKALYKGQEEKKRKEKGEVNIELKRKYWNKPKKKYMQMRK